MIWIADAYGHQVSFQRRLAGGANLCVGMAEGSSGFNEFPVMPSPRHALVTLASMRKITHCQSKYVIWGVYNYINCKGIIVDYLTQ